MSQWWSWALMVAGVTGQASSANLAPSEKN